MTTEYRMPYLIDVKDLTPSPRHDLRRRIRVEFYGDIHSDDTLYRFYRYTYETLAEWEGSGQAERVHEGGRGGYTALTLVVHEDELAEDLVEEIHAAAERLPSLKGSPVY